MLENGFVKLPRCITKRSWFSDRNTLQLYVTLLLKATFRESEFEGVKLKPGQLITSRYKLMEATYLTEQQTKTALNQLKATGDITVQSTPKFSIITLNYYSAEQSDIQPDIQSDIQQGIRQSNHIRRKEKEEGKEEGIKEEREEGGASPAPHSSSLSVLDNSFSSASPVENEPVDLTGFKARLVKEYGSDLVERYEQKFKAWSSAKNAANVPMYPTIAKWLAADAAQTAPKPQQAAAPQPPKPCQAAAPQQSPKPSKHIDTDKLRRAVLASYRKQ